MTLCTRSCAGEPGRHAVSRGSGAAGARGAAAATAFAGRRRAVAPGKAIWSTSWRELRTAALPPCHCRSFQPTAMPMARSTTITFSTVRCGSDPWRPRRPPPSSSSWPAEAAQAAVAEWLPAAQ